MAIQAWGLRQGEISVIEIDKNNGLIVILHRAENREDQTAALREVIQRLSLLDCVPGA